MLQVCQGYSIFGAREEAVRRCPSTEGIRPPRRPGKPVAQQEVLPIAPEVIAPPGGALAGLPSAIVAAEGVLHADPPDAPWQLPSLDLLEEGSASRSGKDEVMRNTRVIEETLAGHPTRTDPRQHHAERLTVPHGRLLRARRQGRTRPRASGRRAA